MGVFRGQQSLTYWELVGNRESSTVDYPTRPKNFMSPGELLRVLGARSVSHQGLRAVANPEVGKFIGPICPGSPGDL